MKVAVRSDLVAGAPHRIDELGMTLGHPADDEEGRADVRGVEQVEQNARRQVDA